MVCIIPAAGLGTRVKHKTKGGSKEMLMYNYRPAISYALEEAVQAGCTRIVVVSSKTKLDLNSYITNLQSNIYKNGVKGIRLDLVFQTEPKGLGDAIVCGRHFVKYLDSFSIIIPDEVFPNTFLLKDLQKHLNKGNRGRLGVAVKKVPRSELKHYGVVVEDRVQERIIAIQEKPKSKAEGNHVIVGRYILPYHVLAFIDLYKDFTSALNSIPNLVPYRTLAKRIDMGKA